MNYLPQPSSRTQLVSPMHNERASSKALASPLKLIFGDRTSNLKKKGDISDKIVQKNLSI
jgi:hypothetical protein